LLGICFGTAFRGMAERRVKLFRNGRNQAVRIPREFELPGADATIRREGRRLIIEPAPPQSLLAVLATLATLEEDFPPTEDRQAEPTPSLPSPATLSNPPPPGGEGKRGRG
jgi:antitoxin VapB